jgi:hypothetical protein
MQSFITRIFTGMPGINPAFGSQSPLSGKYLPSMRE